MITRILLLLLWIFSISSSFKHDIDLSRCFKDMKCFVRESCIDGKTESLTLNKLEFIDGSDKLSNSCDVILQSRSFSTNKFHIMIQVNASKYTNGVSKDGVSLIQGGMQFKCDENGPSANPIFITEVYDKRNEDKILFCSFTIKTVDEIHKKFTSNDNVPSLVFTTDSTHTIKFEGANEIFWRTAESPMNCDPDFIKSPSLTDSVYIYNKVDTSVFMPIICDTPQYMRILYQGTQDPKFLDINETLKCEAGQWSYKFDSNTNKIPRTQTFDVHCVEKMCSLCGDLEEVTCKLCDNVKYTSEPKKCKLAKCANNKWRFPKNIKVGELECKKKKNGRTERESAWYIKEDSEDREITQASCVKKDDCWEVNKIISKCPSTCSPLLKVNGSKEFIYCPKNEQLNVVTTDVNTGHSYTMHAKSINCTLLTGDYVTDIGGTVPENANIYCLPIPAATTVPSVAAAAAPLPSGARLGMALGGGFLLLFVLVGLCAFFVRRYVRRFDEAKTRAEEESRKKARRAALAAVPNPDVPVDRRDIPENEKTMWEKRYPRSVMGTMKPKSDLLLEWDDTSFLQHIVHFNVYSRLGRLAVLYNLTALNEYAIGERPDRVPGKKWPSEHFGNLKQFFNLWKKCTGEQLDDWTTWEYMFRFMKLLYENFVVHDDQRQIAKKMMKLVVEFARPMLTELTYKMRDNEDSTDTWIRFVAVRMLLWAEAPDVLAELGKMADLPLKELQSPMRAVVLQYATHDLGRAEAVKEKYWELVEEDPQSDPGGTLEQFGTLRQHILYGLCAARDESKRATEEEFKMMKDTLTTVFNFDHMDSPARSFSPIDQYWAIRGAADYVCNMKTAVETITAVYPEGDSAEEKMERLTGWRCNHDREQMTNLRRKWKPYLIDSYNLVGEMCTMKKQFSNFNYVVSGMVEYTKRENDDRRHAPIYPVGQLCERATNFNHLFSRKVNDIFNDAVEGKEVMPDIAKIYTKKTKQP